MFDGLRRRIGHLKITAHKNTLCLSKLLQQALARSSILGSEGASFSMACMLRPTRYCTRGTPKFTASDFRFFSPLVTIASVCTQILRVIVHSAQLLRALTSGQGSDAALPMPARM